MCHILQGCDVRSVHALVPDSRGLERNFHDVTIVDMENLPEVSVSIAGRPWSSDIWCGCGRTCIQCVQRPGGGSGVLVRGGVPTVIK